MQEDEIKQMIEAGISSCEAFVSGDGTHFEAVVVSGQFKDKSLIERHRLVYSSLGNSFQDALHALSIRPFTPEEWKEKENT